MRKLYAIVALLACASVSDACDPAAFAFGFQNRSVIVQQSPQVFFSQATFAQPLVVNSFAVNPFFVRSNFVAVNVRPSVNVAFNAGFGSRTVVRSRGAFFGSRTVIRTR